MLLFCRCPIANNRLALDTSQAGGNTGGFTKHTVGLTGTNNADLQFIARTKYFRCRKYADRSMLYFVTTAHVCVGPYAPTEQADANCIDVSFNHRVTFFLTFLAQLSRRLIGELIIYPWLGVRRRPSSSVRRRPSTFSNIFFSKTARPIKAKFYVEPPWVGETKVCSRHLGHMTKMAATPIYGKNPSKNFFSGTG